MFLTAWAHPQAKRTTQFRKLFKAYCERQAVAQESVSFLFEGSRVRPEQTPEDLGMEGGCLCLMFPEQFGRELWKMQRLITSSAVLQPLEKYFTSAVHCAQFTALKVRLISICVVSQIMRLLM
jgi:hypothetical protein